MLAFLILLVMSILVGVSSYFASAWFGYRSSGGGNIPPYYQKLLDRFKPENDTEKADHDFTDDD